MGGALVDQLEGQHFVELERSRHDLVHQREGVRLAASFSRTRVLAGRRNMDGSNSQSSACWWRDLAMKASNVVSPSPVHAPPDHTSNNAGSQSSYIFTLWPWPRHRHRPVRLDGDPRARGREGQATPATSMIESSFGLITIPERASDPGPSRSSRQRARRGQPTCSPGPTAPELAGPRAAQGRVR